MRMLGVTLVVMSFFIAMMMKRISGQSAILLGDDCHNSTSNNTKPQSLSASYQSNMNEVLSWLSTDAATSKGYNHTSVGTTRTTLCTASTTAGATTRKSSASSASPPPPERYDYCFLRYSNENFIGKLATSPSWHTVGSKDMVDPSWEEPQAVAFMKSIIAKATTGAKAELYATGMIDLGGGRLRYGLLQCGRDKSSEQCRECGEAMLAQYPSCCQHKQGWQVVAPSCVIKYDDYMFYQSSHLHHLPPQVGSNGFGNKTKALVISFEELTLESTHIFHDSSQRESSLNTDLPTIPLMVILQSTYHFSEASKLGEGGFGPVYKPRAKATTTPSAGTAPTTPCTASTLPERRHRKSHCQLCVSTGAREILQRCPNRSSVVLWYDYCILRYSNSNFIGQLTTSPTWEAVGPDDMADPSWEEPRAEAFMKDLIATADLSATGEIDLGGGKMRYGMIQCARDINSEQCRECGNAMLQKYPSCCQHKQRWEVVSPSCIIEYDANKFYQTSSPSSSTEELELETTPMFHDSSQRESSLNTDLPTIPLMVIQQSTNHFSEKSKLGEGGFGPVYKGTLSDGREVAVKRLSKTSGQGLEEFKNEVIFIAKLQHRNLVRLLGCCIEENEKILVYEYMENSSLDFHLFILEDTYIASDVLKCVHIGLLCVQEDAADRPTMSLVVVMLASDTMTLPNPKKPAFSVGRMTKDDSSTSKTSKDPSVNEVTVSHIVPR
ncbi:Cysteine-rich receptor-like protein kinase 10 [Senna tora]|uniref:non-specific serine/threonine protein kinase n=1 Tax=Senna tora TaxID=362788 RepID=A0A834X0Y3_9FABA|nr:Cysteine-rich receptor-like protein kinase 10 [Senna tora]